MLGIRRIHRALVGSSIAMVLLAVLALSAPPVAAEDLPISVLGYIYDAAGDPVEGADVTVTVVRTSAVRTTTTDVDGFYTTQGDEFTDSEFDEGDTVRVLAVKGSDSAQNEAVITADVITTGYAVIDVHFTYEIPEFGSLAGVVVSMGAVAVIGSVAFSRRRKGPK